MNPSTLENDCPSTVLTVREVAERLRVPASWIYDRTRRQGSLGSWP